jgi:SAM-dependent methyltransferase
VRLAAPADALDVGCGEGRFCRRMRSLGVTPVGIDPTAALIDRARALDPGGDYRLGEAEALRFDDSAFDMVVVYLTLIDVPELEPAVAEMARVLRPGGRLLIANLTSFTTAGLGLGWRRLVGDRRAYVQERAEWCRFSGVRVRNWHRPLSRYMRLFLDAGLVLSHFDEPQPTGGNAVEVARYRRAPWFLIMEWAKPVARG